MLPQALLELIGDGQAVDLAQFSAITDYQIVVPRMQVAVAPGAGLSTRAEFSVKVSNGFAFLWSGLRGSWNHGNWKIQIFDPFGQAMQSQPALGPNVFIGAIGRPMIPMMIVAPGGELRGEVLNLDTGTALTLDFDFLGMKCAPPR